MAAMDDSPYTILASDTPGCVLVSHPLSHDNWNSWKKAMTMALEGKNKFGFVDGSIPAPPPGDPNSVLWRRNNNIVASWLMNSLTKEMQSTILHCNTAMAIWQDLKDRFEQKNGPLLYQLKRDLANLQQGTMSVTSYYAKIRSLWEALAEIKPPHTCNCGGVQPWCDFSQLEYGVDFLMGLNESFFAIRGQILSMEPFPPITKIFSLVIQEEKQKEVGSSSVLVPAEEAAHAFAGQDQS